MNIDIDMIKPFRIHSKRVWQEVHEQCQLPHNTETCVLILTQYNPKIKLGKEIIYWVQWLSNFI